jgi:hypothetical protein
MMQAKLGPVDIPKGVGQVVRVEKRQLHGYDFVSVRVFYKDKSGELKPGRQGIAFKVAVAEQVAVALHAIAEAEGEE